MKHTLRHFTTDRHAQVDIIHAPDTSVIEARFCFDAGFLYFDKATYHVPHMLEHLLLGHSTLMADDDILMRALQRYGAVANASTDHEYIIVQLRTPRQHFEQAFNIVLSNIYGALIKQKTLDIEREIILRETYEKMDGPGAYLTTQIMANVLPDLEPSNIDEHLACIENITVEQIQKAYDQYIRPEYMRLILAGDIPPALEKQVKKALAVVEEKFKGKEIADKPVLPTLPLPESNIINLPVPDDFSASFAIVNVTEKEQSPDKKIRHSMTANLFFGMPAAIISTRMRKLGLAYSVDFDVLSVGDKYIAFLAVMAPPDKIHDAIFEIESLFSQYSTNLPAEDLEDVKGYAASMIPTLLDTSSDLMEWYLPPLLGRQAVVYSPEEEIKIISNTTAAELQDAVRDTYLSNNMLVGLLCHDANAWGNQALHILTTARAEGAVPAEDQVAQAKQEIAAARAEASDPKVWWRIFTLAQYGVFMSLLFISNLPIKGRSGTTTFIDYMESIHNWQLAVLVLVPLCVASLLALANRRQFTRPGMVYLSALAGIGYFYSVVTYFGDVGIEVQPWYEDAASVVQPIFFIAAMAMAIIMTIQAAMFYADSRQKIKPQA